MQKIPSTTPFSNLLSGSTLLRTSLGFAISGVLLWLTIRSSNLTWKDLWMTTNQGLYFTGSIAAFLLAVLAQSQRTKCFWKGNTNILTLHTYESLVIGNFYNAVLPGNLGEGVRALHLSRKNNIPFLQSLASVVTEKWLDSYLYLLFIATLFIGLPPIHDPVYHALISVAVLAAVLQVAYLIVRSLRPLEKFAWGLATLLKKPGVWTFKLYLQVNLHIRYLYRSGNLKSFICYCLAMTALNCAQYFLLLKAAQVPPTICTLYTSYLATVSMMVVAFIPSAPGNLGVIHYGMYLVLLFVSNQYNFNPDATALRSYALFGTLLHLSCFIPEVILGALIVIKERKKLF
ncbi:MAG: lysylphosphatidylglycerol synthase transmembrane domain-containing protein [Chitinophagales bacterium]